MSGHLGTGQGPAAGSLSVARAGTGSAEADRMIFPGLIQEEVLSCSKLPVLPIDHC